MENWGITVTQAADNSEAEFTQDIQPFASSKPLSERGAAATLEPRFFVEEHRLNPGCAQGYFLSPHSPTPSPLSMSIAFAAMSSDVRRA